MIKDANILVVGDSGYLGRSLAQALLKSGNRVTGLSRNDLKIQSGWQHLSCDVSDLNAVTSCLKGRDFDFVFSLVGCVDHRTLKNGGAAVIRNHYVANLNLMETFANSNLKRFVVIGSADEYADKSTALSERDPLGPFSPYSAAKAGISQLIPALWQSDGFPGVVGRLFLGYGPGQDANRIIPTLITKCLKDEVVDLSPGDQSRDYCYIDDVISALQCFAISDKANGEIFNIGSGVPTKVKDLALMIQSKIGRGKLNFGALPYRAGEKMSVYADMSKCKKILNWEGKTTLDEGLQRTIESFKSLQN